MKKFKAVLEKYLLLWLILSSGLALVWDRLFSIDIFANSGASLPWMIMVTMFAIGWLLPIDEVRQVLQRWGTVIGGTTIQYVAMPTTAYLLATQFGFSGPLLIGLVMVGCVPGAMASNVLTLMARGNTSYSVSLTTMATLLSPLVVPMALWLTLGESVSREKIFASAVELCWMVVLPVVVGHLLARALPRYQEFVGLCGSIIANLTILWIIAFVVAANRQTLGEIDTRLLAALLLLNLVGYLAGFCGGTAMRMPTTMRRALTLEVGMQNAGLGTALATSLFDDPLVAVPPALYTFGCMLTGTILARVWQSTGSVETGKGED